MNILYFSQIYLSQGGGEKNLLQLGEYFKKENNIFLAAPIRDDFKVKASQVFSEIFILPGLKRTSLRNILVYQKIKKIIQEKEINIVHTINPRARFLAIILKKRLNFKLVHTVHSSPFLYQKNWLKNLIFKKIEKFLNQRTDQIIFVSQNTQNIFLKEKLLPRDNHQVIYNGLDLEYCQKFLIEKKEIRTRVLKKFNLKENNRLISFVGRFSFEKNLLTLVKIAPKLVQEFPYLKFILVGEGEEQEKLTREINKNNLSNHFIFPGFLEKELVYEIISASDLFVLPSFYETFSYTVLEALALATPVVATRVGGVQELIDSGVNGFLVPRNDISELRKKIKEVLEKKEIRERFSQGGLLKAQQFSEKEMIKRTNRVYLFLYEQ